MIESRSLRNIAAATLTVGSLAAAASEAAADTYCYGMALAPSLGYPNPAPFEIFKNAEHTVGVYYGNPVRILDNDNFQGVAKYRIGGQEPIDLPYIKQINNNPFAWVADLLSVPDAARLNLLSAPDGGRSLDSTCIGTVPPDRKVVYQAALDHLSYKKPNVVVTFTPPRSQTASK